MDEGWAEDTRNPFIPNKNVDVHLLVKYAKERNVKIILWLPWLTVENNWELFKTFSDWGIAGVKIDFMNRSDQCKHSKKCTFYTLRFGCSFAAVNTIKPQLL